MKFNKLMLFNIRFNFYYFKKNRISFLLLFIDYRYICIINQKFNGKQQYHSHYQYFISSYYSKVLNGNGTLCYKDIGHSQQRMAFLVYIGIY